VSAESPTAAPASWAEAIAELESIVAELERDDVDVDVLVGRVERAEHLVGFCKERLEGARHQVEEIVLRIEPPVDGADP
jgi:exodeoxyribonuclease VII small subunit